MSRLSVEERRSHLIDAAIRLAERKGISGVTTRDVAKAAGVSLGVVHYCFENKDALMIELVRVLSASLRDCVDIDTAVWQRVGEGEPALRALMRATFAMVWLNVEASRDRQMLAYEATSYLLREGGSMAAAQYLSTDAAIAELLTKAADVTGTTWALPVDTLSRCVATMLDGIVLRWLVDDSGTAARRQLDLITDLIVEHAS